MLISLLGAIEIIENYQGIMSIFQKLHIWENKQNLTEEYEQVKTSAEEFKEIKAKVD